MGALRKEFLTALMIGLVCGVIVGLVAWAWRGSGAVALVIGVSISASIVAACLIGVTVPAVLHRFKLGPRIASGPVSLALVDLFTLLVYLKLVAFVLRAGSKINCRAGIASGAALEIRWEWPD